MVAVDAEVLRMRAAAKQGTIQREPSPDSVKELTAAESSPQEEPKEPVPNSSLWTIHGARYDLREYIHRHPGGVHAISLGQGIDCTTLFETYHPFTDRHRKVLQRHKFDDCPEARVIDDMFDWKLTPFYDELKCAARTYFSHRGDETDQEVQRNSKATWASWLQHSVGMCLLLFTFWKWLGGAPYSTLYFPVVYWVVASDLMHNGSHFAMARIPWINQASAYIGSFHVQVDCWDLQHIVGHHCHTNVEGHDPDLCHFTHDTSLPGVHPYLPGFRVCGKQAWLPKYGPLWKFAVSFHLVITTFAIAMLMIPRWLTERSVGPTPLPERIVPKIKRDRALLLAACVMFVSSQQSIGRGVFILFWSWAVHGVLFLTFSQISHVNEECMNGVEAYSEKRGDAKLEWASHQVLSAYDYSCDSKFWSIVSINLNQQICHHLLPSVHPCHYAALRQMFMPIAAKYGIDFEARSSDTFLGAVAKTLGWIGILNERGDDSSFCRRLSRCSQSTVLGVTGTGASLFVLFLKPWLAHYNA